ncbi:MAG: putative farnesyl pyrophosphate synthase, partial [Streblomastix strix]
ICIKHFASEEPFIAAKLINLFDDVTFKTELGQRIDSSSCYRHPQAKTTGQPIDPYTSSQENFHSVFSLKTYDRITKYKTGFYTFYLPLVAGIICAGADDWSNEGIGEKAERKRAKLHKIEEICLELGKLFQSQDDFLDCFGNYELMGKVGRDIQDGKCTWLSSTALSLSDPDKKKQAEESLKSHYGSEDPEDISAVKEMYKIIGV